MGPGDLRQRRRTSSAARSTLGEVEEALIAALGERYELEEAGLDAETLELAERLASNRPG